MNKITIAVVSFLVAVAIVGAYFFPRLHVTQNVAGSAAGTTFNTAKNASVVVNLANPGAGATSTSITNTDASDRYITNVNIGCEGVGTSKTAYTGSGLATLQVNVATTSTANPAGFLYNFAIALNQVIATGTQSIVVASTSPTTGATSSNAYIWPAGTSLTFWWNATNTAVCTEGVSYFGS